MISRQVWTARNSHKRNQHDAADQPLDRALRDGRELLVGERDLAGDPHPGLARFHERQLGDNVAHHLGRRAARLQRAEILPRLHQHEPVLASQLVEAAAQQALPGQWLRMPVQRGRHRLMKAPDRRQVGSQIGIRLGDPNAQQGQRGEQASGGRIGDELAQEGLRVDGLVHQVGKLLRLQKQQPLLGEEWRGVRPAHRAEVGRVSADTLRQLRCGGVGLLRDARVDHRHQQVTELGKILVHLGRALPPGQPVGEHQVGVGAHAEVSRREPGGEHRQQDASQHEDQ